MTKIMFNDKYGLTEAVLNGKKTQTRRVFNLDDTDKEYLDTAFDWDLRESVIIDRYAKYKVGEVVAVAQSYNSIWQHVGYMTAEEAKVTPGYRNKMFVKAELMPHHIRITNIRVERLQDISDEDCLAEGVYYHTEPPKHHEYDRYSPWAPSVKPYKFESEKYFCSAKYAFKHLIDKVSGTGVWESNPYVFVYEFVVED